MKLTIFKILLTCSFVFFYSCSDLFLTEIELAKTNCINDDIECTYLEHIKPIFMANCLICHEDANNSNGNLNLSSYAHIMSGGDSGNLIGDNLQNSILYQKIIGNNNYGSQMPPGQLMSQNEIDIIAKWINNGANE